MILRSIEISGWRCFFEPVRIGPFDEGLNVIFGPNGIGKSTIFEALLRGLIDSHRVTGREVELLRPWGRELSPKVTIEFIHNGEEYRIIKQFLDASASRLERKENGRFRPLAENDKADEKVRSIITKNPPGRGLSQVKHWGLAQVLWAPQGNLSLKELSDDLVSDIQEMLGVQISGPGGSPIEEEIENLYSTYYTKSGKLRTGRGAPEISGLTKQLEDAKTRLNEARQKHIQFEDLSHQVEDLRLKQTQIKIHLEEISKRLKEARKEAEEYNRLNAERKEKEQAVKACTARYNELKNRIEQIERLQGSINTTKAQLDRLQEQLPLLERELNDKEKVLASAKTILDEKRAMLGEIEGLERKAQDASKYHDLTQTMKSLEATINKIEDARKRLNTIQVNRAKIPAPDSATLKRIRKLIQQRDNLKLTIDASMINLELIPKNEHKIKVFKGEQAEIDKIQPGIPTKIRGVPEIIIDIKGFGRLKAWGPAGDIEETRTSLSKTIDKLLKLTEPYGTDDLEHLESLHEKAKELDGLIRDTQTELETLLDGMRFEDILQEKASIEANLSRLIETYHEWQTTPPDTNALRSEVEELRSNYTRELKICEAEWQRAQEAYSSLKSQKDTIQQEYKSLTNQLKENKEQLDNLTGEGKRLEELKVELKDVLLELDVSKTKLNDTFEKLSNFDEDPNTTVESLGKEYESVNADLSRAIENEKKEEGRLEHILSEGPYSRLVILEDEVSELENRLRKEELRANAIKLLHDVIQECRSEIISSVSRPVEQRASRIFHRIVGRSFDNIHIDETFTPDSVKPGSALEPVHVQNLSGGEKEQLYLATRLALTEVLAREERQLVVLDDVLTATDSGRLLRVMRVLEESAEKLQILILTCHPERYRILENAKFFDMKEVVESAI